MRDVAGAVLLRELLRFWVGGVVLDDDELGAVLGCACGAAEASATAR